MSAEWEDGWENDMWFLERQRDREFREAAKRICDKLDAQMRGKTDAEIVDEFLESLG